jgi:hypothetical protein
MQELEFIGMKPKTVSKEADPQHIARKTANWRKLQQTQNKAELERDVAALKAKVAVRAPPPLPLAPSTASVTTILCSNLDLLLLATACCASLHQAVQALQTIQQRRGAVCTSCL